MSYYTTAKTQKHQGHTNTTDGTENIRYLPARRSQKGIWWGSQTHHAARNQLDWHYFHLEQAWSRLRRCMARWYRSWLGSVSDKHGTLSDKGRNTLRCQEIESHYSTDQHCLCHSHWWMTSASAQKRLSKEPA